MKHHRNPRLHLRRKRLLLLSFTIVCIAWYLLASAIQPDPCETVEISNPILASNEKLPKIIHQQWKNDDLPPLFRILRAKVRALFREEDGFVHMLWTDASALSLIATHYPVWLEAYKSLPRNITKADAARCFILHKYGGLYLDADYEPLENFWRRLPDDGPAFIESPWTKWPYAGELHQNSLMSSPAGNEFWNATFSFMFSHRSDNKRSFVTNSQVLDIAGPRMIDAVLREYEGTAYSLSCNNWHRMVYPSHKQWYRKIEHGFAFFTFGTKMCGWPNAGCHYGIHHGSASWN